MMVLTVMFEILQDKIVKLFALFIGPGPFVKMISELSDRQPMIMGKPSLYLKTLIKRRFKISDAKRTLIIGDT